MPYVSVFGNQNQSTPSPSNNTGYQSVFGGNTTWTNTQPSQPANTSKPQQSNPAGNILSGLGSAVQNVVTAVQSWFTPSGGNPTPVKLTNTQINQVQQAPAGLKVGQKIPNYQSPTQSSSAQPTKTASNIFDTSNYFPGVLDTLQQIGVDPLNLQSDPKKVIADAWNSIASAFNNVGKEGYQLGQDIRNQQSGSKITGDVLQSVSSTAGAAFSPISALFSAANDLPVVGAISKLAALTVGTIPGEAGSDLMGGFVDSLPIPQATKNNLKPGLQEIGSLAAQLALGKIGLDTIKTDELVKTYGAKDAATIVNEATKAADTYPTDGTLNVSPSQATSIVTGSNLQDTPVGNEILKNVASAQRSGDNLVISVTPKDGIVPEGSPLNIKTPGGTTITDISLGKPLDQIEEAKPTEPNPIEPSVLQSVNTKTGEVTYQTVPEGQLANFHNLVDETSHGVAGKDLNGQIYHLTAKTPEQMDAAGAKFTGEANLSDLQSKIVEDLKTVKTPDDKILNPILNEIDKQLNGTIESNGTSEEGINTQTKNVQSEGSGNQNAEAINTENNQATQLSDQSSSQNSQDINQSSQPAESQSNVGNNQGSGIHGIDNRSESANPTDNGNASPDNSVNRTTGSGQGLKVYHGSATPIEPDFNDPKGFSLTTNKDFADERGAVNPKHQTSEFTLNPKAKILDANKLPKNILDAFLNGKEEMAVKYARNNGYDAIDFRSIASKYGLENEAEIRAVSKNAVSSNQSNSLKVSKIAKEIDAKAVEKGIINKGSDQLAGYSPIKIKDQAARATDLVSNHFQDALNIVKGDKPLPDGLKGTSLITALEEHLTKNPDPQVLMDLAKSRLITGTSEAAQELRLAAERDPYSPLTVIKNLEDDKRAVVEKQYKESADKVVNKEVTKASDSIDKQLKSNSGSKAKLADFIRNIQC